MSKINLLTDYYPVYKDISEMINNKSVKDNPDITTGDSYPHELPEMFTAEALVDICCQNGFSVFQVIVLLLKNTFEGHVYLSSDTKPGQLSEYGIYKIKDKPELLIHTFYEQLDSYWAGIKNGWKLLAEKEENLDNICFESVVFYALANQMIRLPVSVFATVDIHRFTILAQNKPELLQKRLSLTILGEYGLGKYLFIENVNNAYEDKFKDLLRQLRLKEDVLMHHDRKLFFAYDLNVKTEDELDSCMYKYLVDSKLNRDSLKDKQITTSDTAIPEASKLMFWIKDKSKSLYRLISRNCREVHNISDSESKFPELYYGFLKANSIYNERVSDFPDALIRYMRMVHLFSRILIYRKTYLLEIIDELHSEKDIKNMEMFICSESISLIRETMETKLAAYMLRSQTQIKCSYITDDYMAEIHKDCLQKQIEFFDQQIRNIRQEIKEVLKRNSENVIPLK